MDEVPDESIQMILTSPDQCSVADIIDIVRECYRVLKNDGVFFIQLGHPFFTLERFHGVLYPYHHLIGIMNGTDFKIKNDIVIVKEGVGFSEDEYSEEEFHNLLYPRHEHLLMFTKSDNFKINKQCLDEKGKYLMSDVWQLRIAEETKEMAWLFSQIVDWEDEHKLKDIPTPFYKDICMLTMLLTTDEGDTVLDAACGTGTLGVVAEAFNRNFIGYDIDPFLIELAHKRIERRL
jgi:DNA modification methylase